MADIWPPRPTAQHPPTPPAVQTAAIEDRRKQQLVMARILETGAAVTLGTPEARRTFLDGLAELTALMPLQFTAEEMDVIMDGAK